MLKSLFSSSIRADVLSLLLNSPDEQFYIREIAELLRKNPSGVKAAFLYGPYAEGDDIDTVDLFVIGAMLSLTKELKDIEKRFDRKINCTIIDEDEYKLKKKKSDANLKRLLSRKRITLIGR